MLKRKELKPEYEIQNLSCTDIYNRLREKIKGYIKVYCDREDNLVVEIDHEMFTQSEFIYMEPRFVERLVKNELDKDKLIFNILGKFHRFIDGNFFY